VAPAAAAPAVAPAAEAGRFRLQVAAVRTRAEAEAIAAKVKREFAKKLANHQAVIDSAAVGDMGTFYRVRVGPYANANEPRQLCISMRAAGGYDCMVVTQ
jgi:cell division septation protein DedD